MQMNRRQRLTAKVFLTLKGLWHRMTLGARVMVVDGDKVLLIRHGVTDWNREGRFQGHLDPPLSEVGQREAQLVAERIVGAHDGTYESGRTIKVNSKDDSLTVTGARLASATVSSDRPSRIGISWSSRRTMKRSTRSVPRLVSVNNRLCFSA